jgi:3D (Asp-Asp-Asp) domain-containing protein
MKRGKLDHLDYSKIALILFILALILLLVMMFSLLVASQATAGDVVNFRTARRMASVTIPLDKVTTRASEAIAILICEITAYSPTVAECDASPLVTASGKSVYVGGIAADLRVLPFGSICIIPGYNNGDPCTVIDTGSAIKGAKLDVFMWSAHEAVHWGRRRNVKVQVLYIPKATP